jgi:hypothetical protein
VAAQSFLGDRLRNKVIATPKQAPTRDLTVMNTIIELSILKYNAHRQWRAQSIQIYKHREAENRKELNLLYHTTGGFTFASYYA